jgi:uncharacterized repeat protein (TIGR04076 family)
MEKKVKVIVKEVRGKGCPYHKVGDTFEFNGDTTPGNVCADAFHAIYQYLYAMAHGLDLWPKAKEKLVCCPDISNLVIFELKAVEK